jgi:F-type H+-transporting ATPase subunit alpha
MKKIAGRMRLDLAAFRELEAFAQFGSDLDKSSQDLLNRGRRLLEITKQGQYSPVPVEEEIVQIFAGTGLPDANIGGLVDDIPVDDTRRFINEMTDYLRARHSNILEELKSSGDLPEDLARSLASAIEDFKKTFQKTEA